MFDIEIVFFVVVVLIEFLNLSHYALRLFELDLLIFVIERLVLLSHLLRLIRLRLSNLIGEGFKLDIILAAKFLKYLDTFCLLDSLLLIV